MSRTKKNQESTILDIAAALQLSPATISRALNNNPNVTPATRKKVTEMAGQLGYRRNNMALGLRNNKTHTIGLIVPRISMFFHAEAITMMQNALYEKGYNLIISQSNDSPEMERRLVDTMYSSRVDALIVSCTLDTQDFSHFDVFADNDIPLIFYDRVPPAFDGALIIRGDDFQGGYLAGTHLAETGCKRIAHISGPLTTNLYRDRSAGFFKALKAAGLPVYEHLVFYQPLTYDNTRTALKKMFEHREKPDAVFTANDTAAIAVHEFARENGLEIPRQLKIVGYSNDPRCAIIRPAITSVEQFPGKMGSKVVEALMQMLAADRETALNEPITIPVQLIRRMST
ncbi:LacI family transcriptional regulator [Pedobacter yulinensis]|uniref:LacI family transcriptional regulator n=1 Tax=Pedobacter yulinensis TaxID=2126353 RepID=A0A2T3HPM4_9SPHI|nr:LacI family DNA-binding transcriptional regulator [Pedobacter yulinensis]PST84341.1 LacI family transcriptional regulator [Pedobacter yulinensis]